MSYATLPSIRTFWSNQGARLPATELLQVSWPPLAGYLLAMVWATLLYDNRLQSSGDSMREPYVAAGEVFRFPTGMRLDGPAEISHQNYNAVHLEQGVTLHVQGLINGQVDSDRLPGSEQLCLVHGLEMIVHCTPESPQVVTLHFERVWEVSLLTSMRVGHLELPAPSANLLDGLQALAPHVGHRRRRPSTIAETIFGIPSLPNEQRPENQAWWTVSSLSGKTVRLTTRANGKVAFVQPHGCDLSKNETEWLGRTMLPQLVHAAWLGDTFHDKLSEPTCLQRLLPYDAILSSQRNEGSYREMRLERSKERLSLTWKDQPGFLKRLFPSNSFVDAQLNDLPLAASLVLAHTTGNSIAK